MSASQIRDRIGISDATAYTSDNGGWVWVCVRREHQGRSYALTLRTSTDPTDQDIADIRQAIETWWTETTTPNP